MADSQKRRLVIGGGVVARSIAQRFGRWLAGRCALLPLWVMLCYVLPSPAIAQGTSVLVAVSDPSGIYTAFADALRQELAADAISVEIVNADEGGVPAARRGEYSLTIAAGSRAATEVLGQYGRTPVLLTMLPRAAADRLVEARRGTGRVSAIYIDQPASRYIDLVRVALPGYERIGLLAGRDSRDTVNRLAAVAIGRQLRPQVEEITSEKDIFPALQRLFAEPGILLATADSTVFNAQTIPSILLSAFHQGIPVVGFSPAYVKAGAVVALYSTPAQIARQAAEIVRAIAAGQSLPAAQYPRYFEVGVNTRVARSLDLRIDSEKAIGERLERQP